MGTSTPPELPAAEPGWSTSEGQMTAVKVLVAEGLTLLVALGVVHEVTPEVQAALIVVAQLGAAWAIGKYAQSRGIRKQGTPP